MQTKRYTILDKVTLRLIFTQVDQYTLRTGYRRLFTGWNRGQYVARYNHLNS